MSHIEWKKVEAEVKYLYTLPLCTLLVTHNWQIKTVVSVVVGRAVMIVSAMAISQYPAIIGHLLMIIILQLVIFIHHLQLVRSVVLSFYDWSHIFVISILVLTESLLGIV